MGVEIEGRMVVAVLGAGGTMGEAAREHGDEDFAATYLASAPAR